jgi:hypothetical protein
MPHGEEAVVPLRKLTEYLLSERHPIGRSKAAFFRRLGFDQTNVHLFETALLAIARDKEVVEVTASLHGTKYIIDGAPATPFGVSVVMRTVWIVEPNQPQPRFVTAYPR